MVRSAAAVPMFHETVNVPVVGRPGGMRVLYTRHGFMLPLVRFFQVRKNRRKSLAWQTKVCRAVGLLYDYFEAVENPDSPQARRAYLSDFVQALTAGTPELDGTDPTGLRWPAMGWRQIRETLMYVNAFTDFCATEHGSPRLNPMVAATFEERVAAYRRLDEQNSHSLLKHLGNAKDYYQEAHRARQVQGPRPHVRAERRPPFFPRERFGALLDVGFRRSHDRSLPPWEQFNIRDMMIAILQRHGGLRSSEPFHLWVTDIREDPANPGHALVLLHHPEDGGFRHHDGQSTVVASRREWLKTAYGRVPRNLLSGKERAGWKDLLLDAEAPENYAIVRWFQPEWSAYLWQLYRMYLQHVYLRERLRHPYLFVTLSGANFGEPYYIESYRQSLRRAVERIGLVYAKELGTTTHGLRHAYGQDLSDAKVDEKYIQLCMHHKSIHSQRVYTLPDSATISRILGTARARLYGEESIAHLPAALATA